ncbi:YbhB/YbcL family Raf kinase inhibitor-like protein [Arsenicicoccus dermatophilus]|uniref:YbhB/YbcL family Raf kinase inhibitor-like protein n=1 Tax=Arsenicicoccus dermatophilus TaxID=1076331 RepID=UPI001F4D150F|nr:YbhB/YbcL family Raf kinase inhibitor-like protein [Arsenicicoccus dermatophilus]MCH8612527.1 YbhB/YbcL family Raf kinase inhibitor-like protein [Arsenicicoccus dermatophilus]
MSSLDRPVAPDPYELLPQVGSFTVTSASFQDGATMTDAQAFDSWGMDGDNVSPQLSWSGAPAGTRGYAVTCFDPDAPTPSGFWHWLLVGLPADCTELAEDAGAEHGRTLPEGAFMMANDYGLKAFGGAAPPAGDRPHRYLFAVHALDTDDLGLDDTASGAATGFTIGAHTLARAVITGMYAVPAGRD